MRTYVIALIAAVVAGWIFSGVVTSANAHFGRPGCNCGPIAPTTHYKVVHTAKFATTYHDVSVYKHVHRIHRVTDVTQVQPILHINVVTRVHHHTIVETRNSYHHVTENLTPIRYVTHSTQNYYDCSCGH